jgi:hypothetical protein
MWHHKNTPARGACPLFQRRTYCEAWNHVTIVGIDGRKTNDVVREMLDAGSGGDTARAIQTL